MHLAVVTPFPPAITGIGQYGYYVTRALANSGCFSQLTVLAGSSTDGETPNHLGLADIEYCWQPGSLNASPAILSRLKRLHPDLVWFNLGASMFGRSPLSNVSGSLTPMFSKQIGFPTVVTLHELVEFADLRALNVPGGPFAYWGARLLTHIATHADLLCLTIRQYAERLSKRQLDCVHIPIGAYHEPELLDEYHSQELLFFTTLAPFKGLELLIDAFHRLRKNYPRLNLKIAGTTHTRFPKYARELKKRFDGMEGIEWLGQVPEEQVKDLFRESQVVVVPYSASTGSSSVLYQAATWGRAIVASDLVEIRTLACESDLQIEFFQAGNAESLYHAIRALLDSPRRRRLQAEHNFNSVLPTRPEETGKRYIQALQSTCAWVYRKQDRDQHGYWLAIYVRLGVSLYLAVAICEGCRDGRASNRVQNSLYLVAICERCRDGRTGRYRSNSQVESQSARGAGM
ncbi:MAG TPA: glycosyltransferase, partial [Anaerolineales bacterium]|nr:glycosyltransferase [Anaerolineales bacterium]